MSCEKAYSAMVCRTSRAACTIFELITIWSAARDVRARSESSSTVRVHVVVSLIGWERETMVGNMGRLTPCILRASCFCSCSITQLSYPLQRDLEVDARRKSHLFCFLSKKLLVGCFLHARRVTVLSSNRAPHFQGKCDPSGLGFPLMIVWLVSLCWGCAVIKNVVAATVVGSVASWWFTPIEDERPAPVRGAFHRATHSSFGYGQSFFSPRWQRI